MSLCAAVWTVFPIPVTVADFPSCLLAVTDYPCHRDYMHLLLLSSRLLLVAVSLCAAVWTVFPVPVTVADYPCHRDYTCCCCRHDYCWRWKPQVLLLRMHLPATGPHGFPRRSKPPLRTTTNFRLLLNEKLVKTVVFICGRLPYKDTINLPCVTTVSKELVKGAETPPPTT